MHCAHNHIGVCVTDAPECLLAAADSRTCWGSTSLAGLHAICFEDRSRFEVGTASGAVKPRRCKMVGSDWRMPCVSGARVLQASQAVVSSAPRRVWGALLGFLPQGLDQPGPHNTLPTLYLVTICCCTRAGRLCGRRLWHCCMTRRTRLTAHMCVVTGPSICGPFVELCCHRLLTCTSCAAASTCVHGCSLCVCRYMPQ